MCGHSSPKSLGCIPLNAQAQNYTESATPKALTSTVSNMIINRMKDINPQMINLVTFSMANRKWQSMTTTMMDVSRATCTRLGWDICTILLSDRSNRNYQALLLSTTVPFPLGSLNITSLFWLEKQWQTLRALFQQAKQQRSMQTHISCTGWHLIFLILHGNGGVESTTVGTHQ